jgi:hypothetical protein
MASDPDGNSDAVELRVLRATQGVLRCASPGRSTCQVLTYRPPPGGLPDSGVTATFTLTDETGVTATGSFQIVKGNS